MPSGGLAREAGTIAAAGASMMTRNSAGSNDGFPGVGTESQLGGERQPGRPIFVLGDSRTGTLALHNYFLANGLRSMHYFMRESGMCEPLHLHMEENEPPFLEYVRNSGYEAFSDYPTRSFYECLYREFPNAAFILTLRTTSERWLESMKKFFGKFGWEVDEAGQLAGYESLNKNIRNMFGDGSRRYLEIVIDEDSAKNSDLLAGFLDLPAKFSLSRDNSSESIDNEILSLRHRLYSNQGDRTLEAAEQAVAPSKALLSEYGWVFLVNDTNRFMQVQFGVLSWTDDERASAAKVIHARTHDLNGRNVSYRKFVIPEKSVVYREYLPRVFADVTATSIRPAQMLREDAPGIVSYLDRYLIDARSYGQLYFRGDTHTNWLGAWFVYCFIIEKLIADKLLTGSKIFTFADLLPEIAAYNGDLWSQVDADMKREYGRWSFTSAAYGFELTTKLKLPATLARAKPADVPKDYSDWFAGREVYVYEKDDHVGPRAVIFRDSTLDFCHELLAQHFSRSVFIWHQGIVYEEVIERERPDLVIHVMAERFVTSYPTVPPMARITPQQ